MIALENRHMIARSVDEAHRDGARLRCACAEAGITMRTLQIANSPGFAEPPPTRIVPMLADEGVYVASESSFSRVLRAHGQTRHRGRAKAPQRVRPPSTVCFR